MAHFIYEDEFERIEFEDGEWIDIKREMSYADRQQLTSHYMKIQTKLEQATKTNVDIDFNIESGNIALLLLNVKAWSFKDRDGKPMPINKKTIGMLDEKTSSQLVSEIGKKNLSRKA